MKPLKYSCQQIEEEDIAAVVRVLRSDYLTCGPEVERFEAALCEYTGAKYAVAVNSGTAALHLAWRSLDARREVVTTSPLSFVASANAILLAGMGVAFADVDPATGNLNDTETERHWVQPVHYAGRACPIVGNPDDVVEDACHALGAMDFDGCSRVGSCAHSVATCFSFHPVKPITTGEGGAITTNSQGLADRMRELRSHGRNAQGRMVRLGYNYRMTEMQAALGRSQLTRCDEMRERRRSLIGNYRIGLSDFGVFAPKGDDGANAWHLYPVRISHGKRDAVKAALNAWGIGAQVHYKPIHEQPYYVERFGYKPGDFPAAEAWGREELSLPLHAGMVEVDVARVVDALRVALS